MAAVARAGAARPATLDSAMVDTVLATEATDIPALATLTARGRLRLSQRLMPSTELTELTPTPLVTVTPPSATPVSDTLVLDTLVLDTLVLDTLVLDTSTARGRPRLSPRLMLTTAT